MIENPPANLRDPISSLGQEDPLEESTAAHSSIPARRMPWTEAPGGLWPTESQSRTRLKWLGTHKLNQPQDTSRCLSNGWVKSSRAQKEYWWCSLFPAGSSDNFRVSDPPLYSPQSPGQHWRPREMPGSGCSPGCPRSHHAPQHQSGESAAAGRSERRGFACVLHIPSVPVEQHLWPSIHSWDRGIWFLKCVAIKYTNISNPSN